MTNKAPTAGTAGKLAPTPEIHNLKVSEAKAPALEVPPCLLDVQVDQLGYGMTYSGFIVLKKYRVFIDFNFVRLLDSGFQAMGY